MKKEVIIQAKKLCKNYDGDNMSQTAILQNLDLEVYQGDFTVIMGPSGAGKSTLMYTLSGMDQASDGEINFLGEEIAHYSSNKLAVFRRKHCGYVFQQMLLLDYMSIMDNILTAGFLKESSRKELLQDATSLLEKVNISEKLAKKFPNQVSGGELQRCAIVRAIINKPEVVFADEPTGALNSANSEAVLNVLSNLNEDGESIIMVTHDIKSALRGNRILFLRDGIIFGECNLEPYVQGDHEKRDRELREFLQEMNW